MNTPVVDQEFVRVTSEHCDDAVRFDHYHRAAFRFRHGERFAEPDVVFFGFSRERSLPKLGVGDDEGVAFMLYGVVVFADLLAVAGQRLGGWLVFDVVVSSGAVTRNLEAGFNAVKVRERLVVRLQSMRTMHSMVSGR